MHRRKASNKSCERTELNIGLQIGVKLVLRKVRAEELAVIYECFVGIGMGFTSLKTNFFLIIPTLLSKMDQSLKTVVNILLDADPSSFLPHLEPTITD